MRTIIYYGFLTFAITLTACKPKSQDVGLMKTIKFESAEAIDLGQFIDRVHLVQLENKPESAFTEIYKLIVTGENIFMLDKRLEAVFCFDTTGKFRYRIQRIGRGPGEYKELDAMWVMPAEKELWLQSFWPSRIMVYNFDGRLLRDFPIRWSGKDMIGIGDHLIAGFNTTKSNDGIDSLPGGVFLLNEDGKLKGQSLIAGDSFPFWGVNYQRYFEEFENGALLLNQSDTIFRINESGKSSPEVFLDWGKYKYPEKLKRIGYDSTRYKEAENHKFVYGKDQLVAFGPIRLFRIILDHHMELAMANLTTGEGSFSDQFNSSNVKVPLLYPLGKSDKGELIGIYDTDLLAAFKELRKGQPKDPKADEAYQLMDSIVKTALTLDRPVLWFARLKNEWLTKSF